MIKTIFVVCLVLVQITSLFTQVPDYVNNQFQYTITKDINYGSAIAYDGTETQVLLDIYKPVNDNNCKRPLIIMIHGGAWIAGTKEDYQIVEMSKELASKGWVVAAINYRLGMHTPAVYTPYLLCPANNPVLCARVCDSSEVFRGVYRGMQDAKGAIRFMKLRSEIDSTDASNTFVAGESAGAFVSLYVAFLDQESEKPVACGAIPNAPKSDNYLNYCHNPTTDLSRPDLGDIEGTLHTGEVDASVQGIGNIYGGLMDMNIMDNKKLPMYIFHQASDIIVHYKKAKVLGRLSECLNSICEPFYNMPTASGGFLIRDYYQNLGASGPVFKADILENSTAIDCTINPAGHSLDNINLRTKNMAGVFAQVIYANGNDPLKSCITATNELQINSLIKLYPNPGNTDFIISGFPSDETITNVVILDALGKKLPCSFVQSTTGEIKFNFLTKPHPGIYLCRIISPNYSLIKQFISNDN